jgi:hypothetical protein
MQVDSLAIRELSDEKTTLLEALLLNNDITLSDRVFQWIIKLCEYTSEITIRIVSEVKIFIGDSCLNGNPYAFDFGHPLPVGTRGKSGSLSNTALLVDNENELNRLELTGADSIKVELDSNEYSSSPLAVLVGLNGKTYVKEMVENAGVLSCEFSPLDTGEYRLYVK